MIESPKIARFRLMDGTGKYSPRSDGQGAPVLPKQIAARRVDRLNEIARIGEIHHAAVDERRALLNARTEGSCPDHLQGTDVLAVHFRQGAKAPGVERAPPHEPIGWIGILENTVGNRHELALRLRDHGPRDEKNGEDQRSLSRHLPIALRYRGVRRNGEGAVCRPRRGDATDRTRGARLGLAQSPRHQAYPL